MITQDNWEWFGNAAHFICGRGCQFHLATKVGKYLVSTVGELWSAESTRRIHAEIWNPEWWAKNKYKIGDDFDSAYMKEFGFQEVGCGRKYETMVFEAGEPCNTKGCGCGVPTISGSELDFRAYNSSKEARAGHMELCLKWSKEK